MSRSRPSILQVVPELDAGGAELSTLEVAEAIVVAGGRALIATEGGRMQERISALGAELVQLPVASKNPIRMAANARALARIIRRDEVDIVHARSRAPAWSAYLAARRTGARFVTTYHGAYAERGRLKRAYNSIMARGERVIANSSYTADLIRERYDTDAELVRVINRGVDAVRFDPAAIDPDRVAALRQQWGIEPGRPIVLQPARLTRWKGQTTTIAAAELLIADRGPRPAFVLAGDAQGRDGYADELRAQIDAAGTGSDVFLVGHVVDMPAALAASHVMIIASIEPEAFGRTSAEAQAMGVPVIATAIGAPRDTVLAPPAVAADAATGWLVPPGDARALADAIRAVMALAPAARKAMSVRARLHARRNYSTHGLQEQTLAVYDELIGSEMAGRFRAARPQSESET